MARLGFNLLPGEHPIIPVMLGDAPLAGALGGRAAGARASTSSASPSRWCRKGKARIRTQMNAAHTPADLDRAIAAFATAGRELGIIH